MVAQHWLEQGKVRAWDVRSRLSSSPAGLQGLQHA
jgi:hypothetical protein